MIKKQLLRGLLIVGVSMTIVQCKKNAETPTSNNNMQDNSTQEPPTDGTTIYTYAGNVQAILSKNCSCHVTGSQSPNLSTYANVKSRASNVRSVIQPNGKMRRYTNPDNANIITKWIDDGTPE